MFDAGEQMWPEEAPFHSPRLRRDAREARPLGATGGTTFRFGNDGIETALD
jgi:hypothetical protein